MWRIPGQVAGGEKVIAGGQLISGMEKSRTRVTRVKISHQVLGPRVRSLGSYSSSLHVQALVQRFQQEFKRYVLETPPVVGGLVTSLPRAWRA